MNDSANPQIAAEAPREANRNAAALFENFMLCAPVTKAMHALAEQHVVEIRRAYERSKTALETSMATVERSFDAVGKGAAALNLKVMDIAQRNIDTGFDLAKSLAGARDLAEIVELQAAYWRKQFDVLGAQAEEVRSLSAQVSADATRSVWQPVARSQEELRKAS
jgi:phasin